MNLLQITLKEDEEHQANQFLPTFELILMLLFTHEFPIVLNANNEVNNVYHLIKSIYILQIIIFIVLLPALTRRQLY